MGDETAGAVEHEGVTRLTDMDRLRLRWISQLDGFGPNA
jgi:hypothetical protein